MTSYRWNHTKTHSSNLVHPGSLQTTPHHCGPLRTTTDHTGPLRTTPDRAGPHESHFRLARAARLRIVSGRLPSQRETVKVQPRARRAAPRRPLPTALLKIQPHCSPRVGTRDGVLATQRLSDSATQRDSERLRESELAARYLGTVVTTNI